MLYLFRNGGLFACGCCKKILLSDLAKGWGLAARRVLAKASVSQRPGTYYRHLFAALATGGIYDRQEQMQSEGGIPRAPLKWHAFT